MHVSNPVLAGGVFSKIPVAGHTVFLAGTAVWCALKNRCKKTVMSREKSEYFKRDGNV
jgi:hypothetical protein